MFRRHSVREVGLWALLLLAVTTGVAAQGADLRRANRLLSDGKWSQAATAFEKLTRDEPSNDVAWHGLAHAYHQLGEYDRAIQAGEKVIEFPRLRKSGLYNLACSHARKGDSDVALDYLEQSMAAGFLDFDLLATDPDLESIRDRMSVKFPKPRRYEILTARNGIKIPYTVLLPRNYEPGETYPALVAFPPGGQGQRCADWAMEHLFGDASADLGWIVIVPVVPDNGWINHPSHHALEDLLREQKKKHKIEGGKFHLAGFGTGARPAATYSGMSAAYFQSLSTASAYAWDRWDEDDLTRFRQPVHLYVGEKDGPGLAAAQRVKMNIEKGKGTVSLTVIGEEGYLLPGLQHGEWIRKIDGAVRARTGS